MVAPQPFYEDRGTPIAERHVLDALSDLGYRVDLLTFPVGRSLPIPGVRYIRVPNPLGIDKVPIGFSLSKVWFDCWILLRLLKLLRHNEYHAVHAVEEAAFLAVLTARRKRIPVVYDMQSSIPEQLAGHWLLGTPPVHAVIRACERWLLRRVDSVGCSKGLESRVRAIAPGVRVREWHYPSRVSAVSQSAVARLRSELEIADDAKVVLYAGNFEEYQGVSLLVEAIPAVRARLAGVVFVLVGADGRNGSEVRQVLSNAVAADAYRLLHRQRRESMAAFLGLADVVVSPRTHGSNLPLKTLEYLAAGCAVIATDTPAHSSLFTNDLAVLVAPEVGALSDAIVKLLQDPGRIAELRAAAKTYAEEHLGSTKFRQSLEQLLAELRSDG